MPATATVPEKNRRSRITAACAVCRAKRQKCSGEKPVCDQCRLHNEECWWSETKKRGPAKDYLRSLQDRLQETEKLLVSILGRTSDNDLLDALQSDHAGGAPGPSHQTWAGAFSGQDYWQQHPLNRIETIRAWERHRRAGVPTLKRSNTASTMDTPARPLHIPHDSASSSALKTPPADGMSSTTEGTYGDHKDYRYQPYPMSHQRSDSWTMSEAGTAASAHQRRYSEETREAGEALFSISNHLRTTSQPSQVASQRWPAPMAEEKPLPTATAVPQAAPSQFPKDLFW